MHCSHSQAQSHLAALWILQLCGQDGGHTDKAEALWPAAGCIKKLLMEAAVPDGVASTVANLLRTAIAFCHETCVLPVASKVANPVRPPLGRILCRLCYTQSLL